MVRRARLNQSTSATLAGRCGACALQPVLVGGGDVATPAPGQPASGEAIALTQEVAAKNASRGLWAPTGRATYLSCRRATTFGAFALAGVFVFLVLAALYES